MQRDGYPKQANVNELGTDVSCDVPYVSCDVPYVSCDVTSILVSSNTPCT